VLDATTDLAGSVGITLAARRRYLLPPPAFRECRHRGLARRLVAMRSPRVRRVSPTPRRNVLKWANDLALGAHEGPLGSSASDEGIHASNYRERPTEVAALDGGERSARAAREARLVLYGLAQEGLGAV